MTETEQAEWQRRLDEATGRSLTDRATINRIRGLVDQFSDGETIPAAALRAALNDQETTP